MPGWNLQYGQVAERLQEGLLTKDIPIIFLTALFPKTKEEEQSRVVAGHVFIAKPYDIEELLIEIEKLIVSRQPEVQTPHWSGPNRGIGN